VQIFENPFCVILTHRHGASLAIVRAINAESIRANFIETIKSFLYKKTLLVETYDEFEFFQKSNDFFLSRALGKTAENLTKLYKFSCQKMNIQDITQYVVGIGPGSFTGLRLGCAFTNGLALSSGAELYSVSTLLIDDMLSLLQNEEILKTEFYNELGAYRESDQASGYVTFFDLFFAIHQITDGKLNKCGTLFPAYGRQPTPVLNLRKE